MSYPSFEEMRNSRGPSPGEVKTREDDKVKAILMQVESEINRARDLGFGLFQSAHEGYAIILEELDELKAHVWTKQNDRDLDRMRKEAIEVAAMAVKFVQSLDYGNGRS